MAAKRIPVKLYYDVISPYSYFAFETIMRYRSIWSKMDLQLKPVHLFAILKATENTPPLLNQIKIRQLLVDMKVLPKFFQVPLKFPSNFTPIAMSRDVIPPQRFLMAVQQQLADRDPDQVGVTKLSRAMFATIFESEKDLVPLNKPERLRAIALAAGLDSSIVDEALQQMNSDPVKEGLRRNIMDATQAGVFGTPSFVVQQDQDSYLVFGSDRIEILAYLLGEKYSGPVPSKE